MTGKEGSVECGKLCKGQMGHRRTVSMFQEKKILIFFMVDFQKLMINNFKKKS